MRILLLAPHPFFTPRGTPIAVLAVAKTLARAGHSIDLLTYFEGEDLTIPNVRHLRIRKLSGVGRVPIGVSWQKVPCDAFMLREALRLVRTGAYDVVHAVEEAGFIALLLRAWFGLPYVFDMDSRMSEQIRGRSRWFAPVAASFSVLERATIRRAAGVLAVCPSLVEHARSERPAGPVALLPDLPLGDILPRAAGTAPSAHAAAIRNTPGTRILYVGNLERYQGVELLLDAFARMAADVTDSHLFIAGGDAAGIDRLRAHARRNGLGDRVHLLGATPLTELDEILGAADVLVSPRRSGTNTPMKIYSYMASGRPILATRMAAHTQVLDASIALLVPPTAEALAEGLRALAGDRSLRGSLARAAKAAIIRAYGYEAFERRLLGFYAEIEEGARPRQPVAGEVHPGARVPVQ